MSNDQYKDDGDDDDQTPRPEESPNDLGDLGKDFGEGKSSEEQKIL